MTVHKFGTTFSIENKPRGVGPAKVAGAVETDPIINVNMPAVSQDSDVQGGRIANDWEIGRVESSDVQEFLEPGFRYLDAAMKAYWSDIRVPTNDTYRFIQTKIAGMRTSLQVWTEELKHGRVKLPVISISRTGHAYNPQKFTPPYAPLKRRFVNKQRSRVALFFRPAPWNIDYTLSIWSEHKRDAEYILNQIILRFNPLAELRVSDNHTVGNVQMLFNNSSDASDKEASSEQFAKVKYEVSYTAEAWLSIPEKVMPTILGNVSVFEGATNEIAEFKL